jgi:hypothetical protein
MPTARCGHVLLRFACSHKGREHGTRRGCLAEIGMIQEGDIVEIPLLDGRIAIGRILHLSKHFKDAVGFIVFGIKGEVRNDVVVDHSTGDPKAIAVLGPLYTNLRAA